jgi:hypothetical protein
MALRTADSIKERAPGWNNTPRAKSLVPIEIIQFHLPLLFKLLCPFPLLLNKGLGAQPGFFASTVKEAPRKTEIF